MAIKSLSKIQTLTASAVAYLTAGTNEAMTLSKVVACNTDVAPRTVTVYHDVTGAAGAIASTTVLKAYAISAGETKTLPLSSLFVVNGGKLYAMADNASVVVLDINYTSTEQSA